MHGAGSMVMATMKASKTMEIEDDDPALPTHVRRRTSSPGTSQGVPDSLPPA